MSRSTNVDDARGSAPISVSCSALAWPSAAAQTASSRPVTSFICNKEGSVLDFHPRTTMVVQPASSNGLVDQAAAPLRAGCVEHECTGALTLSPTHTA